MKGEVYPFGIVGMANKGIAYRERSVKFQLCVLGQNAQTMAYNITPCVGLQWEVWKIR